MELHELDKGQRLAMVPTGTALRTPVQGTITLVIRLSHEQDRAFLTMEQGLRRFTMKFFRERKRIPELKRVMTGSHTIRPCLPPLPEWAASFFRNSALLNVTP